MSKGFISNIFLIVLLNVLIKPFYIFGIDAQIQNQVGFEEYGLYFSLLNLSFLFNIVLDFGITNYNSKNIAQHPKTLIKYLGSLVGLRLVLSFLYLVITLVAALLMGHNMETMHLLLFLCFNQILAAFTLYFRSNFAGLHRFKTDAILSVLDRLILIFLCSGVLYAQLFDLAVSIDNFIYAQSISYCVAALTGFILTLRLGKSKIKLKKHISYALLKSSFPYALLILLMMLYTRTDAVMLERLLPNGKEQTGIYAAGFRILDAASIFPLLIAGILLPMFARMLKKKENLNALLTTASSIMLPISIICATICFFYADQLLGLIYTQTTPSTSACFKMIILNFIPISTTYIFGTLLTANGSLKALNMMAIGGFALNLSLNFILIPSLEAQGAAIATLLTQGLTCVAQIVIAQQIIGFQLQNKLTIKLFVFTGILILINLYVQAQFHYFWSIVINLLLAGLLLFSLRIIDLKAALGLLKEKVNK
ncbi:Membrane protein involved in the export of O-antigen and teichoic acid [Lishizhenia tianjinensis]|uniref:Membrane protein involved in the export of O-antigen and teichoic acid n=1 Tax=Lishizhenia tianjinensis TaxID=477690 RepID=A0A1I7BR21_9FLAO|nr:oligosaccharide flippase family protein [Lishizhenia tianjinensis]SFT89637.1 Membrane protein involved in the export of O-antigen and teichoic acid [Lishizhenia tianjinensis]